MFLRIHRSPEMGDVVAVCDRELINTTIRSDSMTVTINEAFYGSTPATAEEVRHALRHTCNANLMGERTVGLAIEMGILTRAGCMMIGTVPHAQIYQL